MNNYKFITGFYIRIS